MGLLLQIGFDLIVLNAKNSWVLTSKQLWQLSNTKEKKMRICNETIFQVILVFFWCHGRSYELSFWHFWSYRPKIYWFRLLLKVPYSLSTRSKWHQETDAIFSIYGRNGIVPWHFLKILSWAFQGRWERMTSDGEILRLRPRNFAIVPESLAPHLEKVR